MKSWEESSKWYDLIVGREGHYYHRHVIMPVLLELMSLEKYHSVIDFACGQGVLSRVIPKEVDYLGIDLSSSLIKKAKEYTKNPRHKFMVGDLEKKLDLPNKTYDCATILLALQNVGKWQSVLDNAKRYLKKEGRFFIVMNHPYFRIPRQTSWHIDDKKKLQSRLVDSYMSEQKIPIQTNPSMKTSKVTFSYHFPLSSLSKELYKKGFMIQQIEEMISDKKSTGKKAKMENRARAEFPLFLCIVAKKMEK